MSAVSPGSARRCLPLAYRPLASFPLAWLALAWPLALSGCGLIPNPFGSTPAPWFDRLPEMDSVALTETAAVSLDDVVRALSGQQGSDPPSPELSDEEPRIVTIAWHGVGGRRVVVGRGLGWRDAFARAREQAPAELTAYRLDLVTGVIGLAGPLITNRDLGWASLEPGELVVLPDARRPGGVTRPAAFEEELAYGFTTQAYWLEPDRVRPLYLGRRQPELTVLALKESIRLAELYLAGAVGADGRFDYLRQAFTGTVVRDYSIVRHAGATYALLEAYRRSRDPGTLDAAERALRFIFALTQPWPHDDTDSLVLVERGLAKLGANALAILAIVEHVRVTGDPQFMPLAIGFARYIAGIQQPDGRFAPHRQFVVAARAAAGRVEYYPGETDLALLRLAELDESGPWAQIAKSNLNYLMTVRDKPPAPLIHDHWLCYALEEVHRLSGSGGAGAESGYKDHAWRIAEAIMDTQTVTGSAIEKVGGWRGSSGIFPVTPAATRIEGLAAIHQILRRDGEMTSSSKVWQSIHLAMSFVLRHQIREELLPFCDRPTRALGGFCATLERDEIRIDYVQHALSAMILVLQVLEQEETLEQEGHR